MSNELLQKYIAGNATEEEKRRVVEWIRASPENMCEYKAQRKLYDIVLWRADEKIHSAQRSFILRKIVFEVLKIAAVLVLVFGGTRYWKGNLSKENISLQTVYVPAGQRAELVLADGTKVWLNSKSTLTFPGKFNDDIRDVSLNGEGYFSVAHNAKHPFIVRTDKWDVRVLGTEFNVKAYANDSVWETSLLNGSVEILMPAGSSCRNIKLEPDTRISLQGNRLVKGHIQHYDYFLWREGLLCFHDVSLGDMMEKLKLYYGVRIVMNNENILQNRYTGKFRTKDGVEHVLRVLRLNNKFTYSIDDETNTITIN